MKNKAFFLNLLRSPVCFNLEGARQMRLIQSKSERVLLIFGLGFPIKSYLSHGNGYRSCITGSSGSTNLISDVNTSALRWIRLQNMLGMLISCQQQEDKQYHSQRKCYNTICNILHIAYIIRIQTACVYLRQDIPPTYIFLNWYEPAEWVCPAPCNLCLLARVWNTLNNHVEP